jgi:phosphoribosylaminoimidazole carboxylase (NCAIR synthetase)
MTDNEIMRALELFKSGKDENFAFVSGNALDLINRQKAEIERLAKGCGIITEEDENWYPSPLKTPEEIKAEAVKEFAERLKEKERPAFPLAMVIDVCEIDNLVKKWRVKANVE